MKQRTASMLLGVICASVWWALATTSISGPLGPVMVLLAIFTTCGAAGLIIHESLE